MRTIFLFLVVVFALAPAVAFAHATPIQTMPRSGAALTHVPSEIAITFSERLEEGSSLIRVVDASGARKEQGVATVASDGRTLSVPVHGGEGIYTVQWSVISRDDGHFTRGSYAFSVGKERAPSSSTEEVIQIASTKEAALIFAEFVGNSILWGVLALFLLARDTHLRKTFVILAVIALFAAFIGSIGQLVLKSHELAALHDIGLLEAFRLYAHTTAGIATMVRGCALVVAAIGAVLLGFRSLRTTAVVIGVPLIVFAYFRATISHATANPFYPTLSVAVNFVHVIEKDLWFGALIVLCVIAATRMRDTVLPTLAPRTLSLLSLNLAVLSASAGYIVWLHLKDLSNVTGSAWGQAFIPLAVSGFVLVVIHSYLVITQRIAAPHYRKYFIAGLGAETAAALLVVFFSSVVIITSPPPHDAVHAYVQSDQGVTIELSRAPYEDGMTELVVTGDALEPVVIIGVRDGGLRPSLSKRFDGGYVFPSALIGSSTQTVHVTVPQTKGYDAHATFTVRASDFAPQTGHGRSIDAFTLIMFVLVVCGAAYAGFLRGYAVRESSIETKYAGSRLVVSFVAVIVLTLVVNGGVSILFRNRFERNCAADGNMWHVMQPMRAGIPISGVAREGCMWGMGQYSYQFADTREYDYLASLGPASVSFDTLPSHIRARVPTTLTFALKNADGSPATLLVDMEKYLHVVIVSEDETVFAHIHPDDAAPLPADAIDTSTFSVPYAFPKAGRYLVSVDYAHGTALESKQFIVTVEGSPRQEVSAKTFPSTGVFGGYEVALDYSGAGVGNITTLQFTVTKDGVPVTTLRPYLSAVSHISVVKNDLSEFMHTHGEVHAPGTIAPPLSVKNGKIVHAMAAMVAPSSFGPRFDAHVIFPKAGRYTVWAQISVEGEVIPASFTVDVE
jgi:methionine-rich copper-binding protein CopC